MSAEKWNLEQELAAAQKCLQDFFAEAAEKCEAELEDIVKAVVLAAVKGPGNEGKLEDSTGNPLPEQIAYKMALQAREFFIVWLESLALAALES